MGLCKCPRKKVTNQFCFEHRVNVCEHCMVSNHSKCIVQSYLQWLQDSDYNPNCHLCKTELAEGDCVRLTCFHVFHWECLNNYAFKLPPQTPVAGYTCPICNICIFPQPNAVSPVTEALKTALRGVSWAKIGFEFPSMEDSVSKNSPSNTAQSSPLKSTKLPPYESKGKSDAISVSSSASNHSQIEVNNSIRPEPYGASYTAPYSSPRKLYDATEHGHFRSSTNDHDENKYERRSALEWFARWFKSKTGHGRNHRKGDRNMIYKKWVVLLVLCLIALCTLCILFLKLGRANADSDPLLDPHFNPNIRVEDTGGEDMKPVSGKLEPNLLNKNSMHENMKEHMPI